MVLTSCNKNVKLNAYKTDTFLQIFLQEKNKAYV